MGKGEQEVSLCPMQGRSAVGSISLPCRAKHAEFGASETRHGGAVPGTGEPRGRLVLATVMGLREPQPRTAGSAQTRP